MKVAILGGGPSSEYAVSLRSAAMVMGAIDTAKYEVTAVTVDKLGGWHIDGRTMSQAQALKLLRQKGIEVVFIAMHGEYGEDGTIQSILGSAGIVYTGSGAEASRLAMDKQRSRREFARHGLEIAEGVTLSSQQWERKQMPKLPSYPLAVKPVGCGSSVGVSIVQSAAELAPALGLAFSRGNTVLIEKFISGREVTCGVLDDGTPVALPPTEIRPTDGGWFDYEAKYQPGASEEITPAPFEPGIIKRIQGIAVTAHRALGCYGMSRTDMIVTDDRIVVLETNTIPGLTETSLLPQQAAAAGISFSQLIDRIIESALKRSKVG